MTKPRKKWSFLAVSLVLFIIACSNPGSLGPAAYRVTYDANGGTGSVPTDAHSYAQGAIVTVPGNTGNMTKPGYFTVVPSLAGTRRPTAVARAMLRVPRSQWEALT
jgi:hypothetical protein